jgi:allophanate hydrolase
MAINCPTSGRFAGYPLCVSTSIAPDMMSFTGEDIDLASLRAFYAAGRRPAAIIEEIYARLERHAACGAWTYIVPKHEALRRAVLLDAVSPASLPLFGVPFSVKDNIDVDSLPTTAGCPAYSYIPAVSATIVERMEAAGAILIGKNSMDQFATGLAGIRSPIHPVNCFDPARVPGGSSSGSAVAVALGLVAISLGSDTGGSGRVPAAFNNIVGFKPTPGLISTAGMVHANRSFDCVPVFALRCEDALEVFHVLMGEDARDPFLLETPMVQRPLPHTGKALTIGVPAASMLGADADAAIGPAFEAAFHLLGTMGAQIVEIDFALFEEASRMVFDGPLLAERHVSVGHFIAAHPEDTHPVVAGLIAGAASYNAAELLQAQYRLKSLQAEAETIMSGIDLLAVPTTISIPTITELEAAPIAANARLGRFTYFANPLGLCGVAVPASFRADGLPFSICLYARRRADAALLAVAARFQQAAGLRPGKH